MRAAHLDECCYLLNDRSSRVRDASDLRGSAVEATAWAHMAEQITDGKSS